MYDYTKLEKKIHMIAKKMVLYTPFLSLSFIEQEITKAYEYAKKAHEGQLRLSGEPYITHPIEAAIILLELKPDIYTVQACILHDVIEDTPITYDDIKTEFWEEVAILCSWMEKLSKVKYQGEDRNIASMRKMFIAMAEDLRVIFIKLSDRLHNMRTLKHHPKKHKQERIAMETLNIYAPIADRLGLFNIKNALEEECFKILDGASYKKIKKDLQDLKQEIDEFSKNAAKEINDALDEAWIEDYSVDFRVKSMYSIHKKIQRKWLENAKQLYDLFWIRIIVPDIENCYKALWVVHNVWKPLPNRFKDYIASPKPNGYKSLHTTIIGLLKDSRKQPTEIQIKTFEMKEYSEIWVAAHFEYKEKGSKIAQDIDWVKELKEITESLENNDLISSLKIDVFKDRIFVFTPKGDTINLPQGSTPVDFAFAIHSDLWLHLAIAKVNGKVYPLDKELLNGDVIEIITDKNKKPNPFWLSFAKTTRAKDVIKSHLKKDNKDVNRDRGKEILNKYLQNAGLENLDKELSLLRVIEWREYSVEERLLLLEQVGNFSLTPSALMRRIMKGRTPLSTMSDKKEKKPILINKDWEAEIIIGWERGISYKKCSTCMRKGITEKIIAHINTRWNFTLHNIGCKLLEAVNKERLLPAYIDWTEEILTANIFFKFQNRIWILKELSDIIYSMGMNIEEISSKKEWIDKTLLYLTLNIPDNDYTLIERLIDRVKINLKGKMLEYKITKVE
jgi:GTP diphosphokinase / guanosine-3',5'-bis(diphosphate) 3'-diphosphatase